MTKILYFIAGETPTTAEQAEIDRINVLGTAAFTEVGVRTDNKTTTYGDSLESADYVAGSIPTAYNGVTDYGDAHDDRPVAIGLYPATASVAAAGEQQLTAIITAGADMLNLAQEDVTASTAGTTYASDDTDKATVSAEGVVTGVAAGEATITATHTYADGKTETATMVVTCTG